VVADRDRQNRFEAVEEWFAARTSSLDDWSVEQVCAAKNGRTVAVVLPALDEEQTVGDIVASLLLNLVRGPHQLIDEVVVVDSGSQDATASVAAASGARVVSLTDILPGFAPRRGKGEAMWRGVAATTADIVVFVDADLLEFDPRFVVALVGPLLADPSIQLVKAAYDRPPTDPSEPSQGGGRVTELMARPMLSAFWPDLSGVLQPLAGEYAARRELLEQVPFRCGYGVDLGLLIDAYRTYGLDGLAQVDLYRRWHQHSDVRALGRMAAEVMHTAFDRLADDGRLPGELKAAIDLWQPLRTEGGVGVTRHEIDVAERPPLRDVARSGRDQPNDHEATK
jgi:glucosyl-3-phosphoglycerate synthase